MAAIPVSSSFLIKMVGNILCVIHLASGQYFLLNATGAHVWLSSLQGKSMESISASLSAAFPLTSADVVAQDTASFLGFLKVETPLMDVDQSVLPTIPNLQQLTNQSVLYLEPVVEKFEEINLMAFSGPGPPPPG